MRRRSLSLVLLLVFAGCAEPTTAPVSQVDSASAAAVAVRPRTLLVTESGDAGPGTLRDALDEASADPTVTRIRIDPVVFSITPNTPLTFTGTQALTIEGGQISVFGHYTPDALFDLRVRSAITITDMWILHSQGIGVRVVVPEDATGTVRVTMHRVGLAGHRGHGVLVNDLPEYLTDPNTASITGAPASLRVEVTGSFFGQIGQGGFDLDGSPLPAIADADAIRINEGGDGNAVVILRSLQVAQAGNDGVHVDERGNGNIDFRFETSTVIESGWATPTLPGNGVRLLETGAGTLTSNVTDVTTNTSAAQAFGYSESGLGNLTANFTLTNVSLHAEDAVVLVEDAVGTGGGNLTFTLTDSNLEGNGQDLQGRPALGTANVIAHEKLGGTLISRVTRSVVRNSLYGGISHVEEAGGNLDATILESTFSQLSTFGMGLHENGAGNLTAAMTAGGVLFNGTVGITAKQAPTGTGSLTLTGVDLQGNGTGSQHVQVVSGQVTVIQSP
ncbi:MAG: hypothetical protein IT357_12420 [Gemmatimonadaceae bacterium]|nr:hypothetical protein [Gemmatimonadaceae bacterium]